MIKWLIVAACLSLALLLLIAIYPRADASPSTLSVVTHCADGVVCYFGELASFTYSCFRDADLVAKYCYAEAVP